MELAFNRVFCQRRRKSPPWQSEPLVSYEEELAKVSSETEQIARTGTLRYERKRGNMLKLIKQSERLLDKKRQKAGAYEEEGCLFPLQRLLKAKKWEEALALVDVLSTPTHWLPSCFCYAGNPSKPG